MGGYETETDFVVVGESTRKYLKDVKAILCELQYRLVLKNIDKRKLKKVVKNEQIVRRRVWKLKKKSIKVRFQERVKELVDVDAPDK